MTKAKKIVIAVLSVVAAILIFVITVGHSTVCFNGGGKPAQNYASILRYANDGNANFGETPITKIALLGSHDALSYKIDYGSAPNVSEDVITNNGFVRFIGKGALVRYSKAQRDDIYTQLNCGVRYIDVRVTNIGGTFYTSHGLVSHKLQDSLLQILRFLSENKGEFIIFHIVHYYAGNSSWAELCEYVSEVKFEEKCLFDYTNYTVESGKTPTYDDVTDGGTNAGVVLLSETNETNAFSDKFNRIGIDSRWHNVTNSTKLKNKINEYAKTLSAPNSRIVVNQAQTTPNSNDIWGMFIGWSLLDMAARHNERMINSTEFDDWLKVMPVYMCDYATCSRGDFNNRINDKILSYNLNLGN